MEGQLGTPGLANLALPPGTGRSGATLVPLPSFTVGCHLSRGRRSTLQVLSFWVRTRENMRPYCS